MPIGALAGAAVQAIAGKALDLGASSVMSGKQYKKQKKLMDKQRGNQEILMDKAQQQQLDMWNRTNYGAQVEHLKNAGLNPGLIYGMGGAGGATVGSAGGSAAGGSAAMGDSGAPLDMAMIMGLTKAQKENIEADTAQKQAETAKTAGVDTVEAQTRIKQIGANIENVEAQRRILNIDERLKEMDEQIKGATLEDAIDMVEYQAKRAFIELDKASTEAYITRTTREDVVKEIQARSIGQVIENQAKRVGIALDKAKIKQISEQIAQGWKGLDQGDTKNAIETFKAETTKEYPDIWKVLGKELDTGVEALFNAIGGNRGRVQQHKMK